MLRLNSHAKRAGLAVCTAMAGALLAGCSGHMPLASSGKPSVSGESADAQMNAAIAKAETRVAKSPRNASARIDLAQAYLAAGRFESAATTFQDAVSLGDNDARIGLGLALSYIGSGRNAEALTALSRWRNDIPASDLGLAVALAGQPAQGVALLSDAVRGGEDSAKARQNLAYAYALNGRWAEARVVASQDVPADQLDARMGEWASRVRPEQYQARVASLLGAPVRVDAGQPVALALNGAGNAPRMASAEVPVAPAAPAVELPPVTDHAAAQQLAQTTVQSAPLADHAAPPAQKVAVPVTASLATNTVEAPQTRAVKFVSQPKVQSLGQVRSTYVAAPLPSTHLVQLGSFSSLEGAKRAWDIYVARNPALEDHKMRITEADVRGKRFFRVAAEGFDHGSAQSLCASVRERGGGCFAYAEKRALPGALPRKAKAGQMLAQL